MTEMRFSGARALMICSDWLTADGIGNTHKILEARVQTHIHIIGTVSVSVWLHIDSHTAIPSLPDDATATRKFGAELRGVFGSRLKSN